MQEAIYIHYHVVKYGLEMDFYEESTLIDMYAKCQDLMNASKMFHKIHLVTETLQSDRTSTTSHKSLITSSNVTCSIQVS